MSSFRRLASPQHTTTARRCSALLACTAVVLTGALVQLPSAIAVPGGGDSGRVAGQTLQKTSTEDGGVSGSWFYEVPVVAAADYEVRLGLRVKGTAKESSVVVEGQQVRVPGFTDMTVVTAVVHVGDGAMTVQYGPGKPLGVSSLEVLPVGDLLPTKPAPAPAPARALFLQPFASASVWNLPIGTAATFQSVTSPRTVALHAIGSPWANESTYSHPVVRATTSDPLATVTDVRDSSRSGTYRIPGTAPIAAGTDRHMHVISPDGTTVDEGFAVERVSTTDYRVGRHETVDLRGNGIGPSNGTRAYGGSAVGGLIRAWEVDPRHPAFTGRIEHALAIALRNDQLLYTGGTSGYSQGYGTAKGYVWPATEQDWDSPSRYAGAVPMGSYVAIPGHVDLATLGLSPQGLMLARAYQDYGAYVTDRSAEPILAYIEPSVAGSAFRKGLLGADWAATDLKKIRAVLRVVSNNSASTPNGAPLGGSRRAPLLP